MSLRHVLAMVPPGLVAQRLGHVRRFTDAHGQEWTVREVGAGRSALVFEDAGETHLLERYPVRWHALSTEELEELLLHA